MPDSLGGLGGELSSDPRNPRSITEDPVHPPTYLGRSIGSIESVAALVMKARMKPDGIRSFGPR
jgi:hypothetical protein